MDLQLHQPQDTTFDASFSPFAHDFWPQVDPRVTYGSVLDLTCTAFLSPCFALDRSQFETRVKYTLAKMLKGHVSIVTDELRVNLSCMVRTVDRGHIEWLDCTCRSFLFVLWVLGQKVSPINPHTAQIITKARDAQVG